MFSLSVSVCKISQKVMNDETFFWRGVWLRDQRSDFGGDLDSVVDMDHILGFFTISRQGVKRKLAFRSSVSQQVMNRFRLIFLKEWGVAQGTID